MKMDFSSQIKNRKKSLKPTKTIFTNNLGERFLIDEEKSIEKLNNGYSFVVDDKPDLQIAKITSNVFLSSQDPIFSVELLRDNNIKNILSIGIEPTIKFDGINYYYVEILDVPEFRISGALEVCSGIIRNCGSENVLVHCNAGVSRAPTVVISYLIDFEKLSLNEALGRVKSVRCCVRPNDGFLKQLEEFEGRKKLEKSFGEDGAIWDETKTLTSEK